MVVIGWDVNNVRDYEKASRDMFLNQVEPLYIFFIKIILF